MNAESAAYQLSLDDIFSYESGNNPLIHAEALCDLTDTHSGEFDASALNEDFFMATVPVFFVIELYECAGIEGIPSHGGTRGG